jgi:hypothetical protein
MPEHWLSYSNSDQAVLRDRDRGRLWDALVVPGTLATYYKQGTGGFVLELRRPFVIDPRTPIIQPIEVARPQEPRASHISLAELHDPDLRELWAPEDGSPGQEVPVEWWTNERWASAVDRVLCFQRDFEREASEKRSKYAQMLEDAGHSFNLPVQGPVRLVPPYWAVRGLVDPWWRLSRAAIVQALDFAGRHGRRLIPVLSIAHDAERALLAELIGDLPDDPVLDCVFCWWGGWDEARATSRDVDAWLSAIDAGQERGITVHNLYGGALSVYMTGLGLAGVNHGVGYSESRDERRLAQTGAPPMRYYMPTLRGFFPVPTAQLSLEELGPAHYCRCPICEPHRGDILSLNHDELKAHFLECRALEFRQAEDVRAAIDDLDRAGSELLDRFTLADEHEPNPFEHLVERGGVLLRWSTALERSL